MISSIIGSLLLWREPELHLCSPLLPLHSLLVDPRYDNHPGQTNAADAHAHPEGGFLVRRQQKGQAIPQGEHGQSPRCYSQTFCNPLILL